MRIITACILAGLPSFSFAQKDTFRVYFNTGSSVLTEDALRTVDALFYNQKLSPATKVGIIGYTDYVGSDQLNLKLSEDRANAVRQYLLQSGFKQTDIQTVIGKGEVARNTEPAGGYLPDRKVEIIPGGLVFARSSQVRPQIDISTVRKNETVRLENINFHAGSFEALPQSAPALKHLYELMKSTPKLKIQIEGHICCDKDPGYWLSTARAKFVYDFLMNHGIDTSRMKYKGFGLSRPLVYPEKTEADNVMNRRVEIRILDK